MRKATKTADSTAWLMALLSMAAPSAGTLDYALMLTIHRIGLAAPVVGLGALVYFWEKTA